MKVCMHGRRRSCMICVHACVQALHEAAPELLALHARLTAGSHHDEAAAGEQPLPVALGNIIRKLKQNWRLGENKVHKYTTPHTHHRAHDMRIKPIILPYIRKGLSDGPICPFVC